LLGPFAFDKALQKQCISKQDPRLTEAGLTQYFLGEVVFI